MHPIHNTAFIRLLSFRVLLVLSYQIMAVTVGWHIYEITHDLLALGLVGLAEVVPYFCCALFAGYAVDHYPRRMLAMIAPVLLCANSLTLTALALGYLSGEPTCWIYSAIVTTGIARAFIAPSYSALFAMILPREDYARASGVGSTGFQIGLMVGPALGGLLVAYGSKSLAYGLSAVFCACAALAMFSLKVKEHPPAESSSVLTSIGEGLSFVYGNQILLAALSLDMFAVLFGGAVAMLPAFIRDVYHHGAEGLGVLRAAPAVGAMLVGMLLAKFPINLNAGRWLLCAVAGFGVCMIAFAVTIHFWLAFAILLCSGVFDGVSVVLRSTILQLSTPDEMRGRVSAINGVFIGSSNELGAFESGLAAKLLGLVPSVIFGGLMTLGVVATTAHLAPKLRKLDLQELQ